MLGLLDEKSNIGNYLFWQRNENTAILTLVVLLCSPVIHNPENR